MDRNRDHQMRDAVEARHVATYREYVTLLQAHIDGVEYDVDTLADLAMSLNKSPDNVLDDVYLLDRFNTWCHLHTVNAKYSKAKAQAKQALESLQEQYEGERARIDPMRETHNYAAKLDTLAKKWQPKYDEQYAIMAQADYVNQQTNLRSPSRVWECLRITGHEPIGKPRSMPQIPDVQTFIPRHGTTAGIPFPMPSGSLAGVH